MALFKVWIDILLHPVKSVFKPFLLTMIKSIYKSGPILLIITLIAISCKKDIKDVSPQQTSGTIKSMSEMKVSSDFNWKTTQSVDLELTVPVKSSLVVKSSAGVIYHKALIQTSNVYKVNIAIPIYEKELNVVINGVPNVLQIDNHRIIHTF
jgi:hypothetical protein